MEQVTKPQNEAASERFKTIAKQMGRMSKSQKEGAYQSLNMYLTGFLNGVKYAEEKKQ